MAMEESRWEAVFLASSWLIPMFHADFPGFTSKIVEHSRYLLAKHGVPGQTAYWLVGTS